MRYIVAVLIILLPLPVFCTTYGDAQCTLLEIIDGDTIKCDIAGYPDIIGRGISVRFRGINTPEIRGKQRALGLISKSKLEALIGANRTVTLKDISRDKYFRIDADIYVGDWQINRNELLQP
ncbi:MULTISPECIES: thermonuclease family protein [Seleniivibrio]|uniref:thermonuclease family protein n=1 Tax=Seleniivibrio TaxID=1649493 RepID=UPI0025EB40DA|nr:MULTISPECIES: thermonuclease family protein [Seleniivibrio]MCD8553634.1 thermonuclease family protein [Seleniivibrio sp.]